MLRRFQIAASVLVAAVLFLILAPQSSYAHSFGTVGYSEITIHDRTIEYVLILDHDQLLSYLPIDDDANGKIEQKEFANTTMIQEFMIDHITVRANGAQGKPEVTEASKVMRNDQAFVRFSYRYTFDQPVRTYEVDYRLYYDDFDNDHKNFAAVKASGSGKDKIFSKSSHVLSGTLDLATEEQGERPQQGIQTWSLLTAGLLVVAVGCVALLRVRRRSL